MKNKGYRLERIVILLILFAFGNSISAQNISINANGAAPDNSAMLDVNSTTRGILIPRMTLVQRNALVNPANSLLIYQTDNTPGYYFNSGTAGGIPVWTQLSTPPDNLGNHIATTNIQLGANYLSGDGDNEGISIDATGNVGIGTNTPGSKLEVSDSATNSITAEIKNENAGATIASTGTIGLRVSTSDNAAVERIGIEALVAGTGAFEHNAIKGSAYASSPAINRGVYAFAANGATNYGVQAFTQGNIGTNYGVYSTVAGSGTGNKYAFYGQMSQNGTKYGVYLLGEDINYFSGSLGVGTNSPSGKMEVVGDGSLLGGLRVSGTTPATVGSSIYLDAATKDWTITATNTLSGAGNDKLVFRDYTAAVDRMTIDNVGNVGIGTTTPNSALEVVGNIEIPAANDYTYSTAKTRFTSIPPSAFVSVRPETYELNALGVILYISIGGSGGALGWASAPINTIPNGARIVGVTYAYYDNDAVEDMSVSIVSYGNTAGGGVSYAGFTSTGSSTLYQTGTSTASLPITLDYENNYYQVYMTGRQGNSNLRLKHVIIEYTVTAAD